MIDFPPNPIDGETYNYDGDTWIFDINMWTKQFKNLLQLISHLDQVNDVEIGSVARSTGNEYLKYDGSNWIAQAWQDFPDNEKCYVWDLMKDNYTTGAVINRIRNQTITIQYTELEHGTFDTATYKYTVPEDGYYMVKPKFTLNRCSNPEQSFVLWKNSDPYIVFSFNRHAGDITASDLTFNREALMYLKTGEKLYMKIHQVGSGDALIRYQEPIRNSAFMVTLIEATSTPPIRYLVGIYTTFYATSVRTLSLEAGTYEVVPVKIGARHVTDDDEQHTFVDCLTYSDGSWIHSWDIKIWSTEIGTIQSYSSGVDDVDWTTNREAFMYRVINDPNAQFTITYTQSVNFNNGRDGFFNYPYGRRGNSWALYKIA